jgi:hypothetical protein
MIKDKVKSILEDYTQARNDDRFLYRIYLYTYHENAVLDYNGKYWVNLESKVEGFDTIARRRREVQAQWPHLRATELATKRRQKHQHEIVESIKTHGPTLAELARLDTEFKKVSLF